MTHLSRRTSSHTLMASLVGAFLLVLPLAGAQAQAGAWEFPPQEEGTPPPAPPAVLPQPKAMPLPAPAVTPVVRSDAPCTSVVVNCPSCRGGKSGCCQRAAQKPEENWEPTPVSGYTLPKGGFGLKIEFGYPNMDLALLYALTDRVQIGIGYRGVYTINNTPYANVKFALNSRNRDVLGLALELGGGYSFGKNDGYDENIGNLMAGEYHAFGEIWLRGTAKRGRHGLLFGVGARISEAVPGYDWDYYGNEETTGDKVMATISLELGYEVRINRVASFFLATGVDIFTSDEWIPALIRFRMGVVIGS